MAIQVIVSSTNVILWDCISERTDEESYYIGSMEEWFGLEKKRVNDKRIKQFKYISDITNTIFNTKQIYKLKNEIKILEEELHFPDKKSLKIIKKGISKALEKNNLYLRFEY